MAMGQESNTPSHARSASGCCAQAGEWTIGVLPGPNAAPDYFTPEDMHTFYSSPYSVHYNSCVSSGGFPLLRSPPMRSCILHAQDAWLSSCTAGTKPAATLAIASHHV